jgi:hypothetical protein
LAFEIGEPFPEETERRQELGPEIGEAPGTCERIGLFEAGTNTPSVDYPGGNPC